MDDSGAEETSEATGVTEDIRPRRRDRNLSLGPGAILGRYVVTSVLGKGGMGTVYAAFDRELDRKVAIKVVNPRVDASDHETWRARLIREAQAMARLSHPNVLTVYDAGTDRAGRVFVAMELVEGGTLKAWLAERPRGWREVVAVLRDAGRGLAAAHDAGIIHRDFKPANVLLGVDGRPRVSDFGLARGDTGVALDLDAVDVTDGPTLDEPSSGSSSGALETPLTRAGAIMGTPGYMAPEQHRGERTDARTDVFAYCATLHYALYGARPFEGKTPAELLAAIEAGRVREPDSTSRVPAWLRRVVLRGLAADPAARWASMRELLDALGDDPSRRRWIAGALAAAAIAAGVVIGALELHHRHLIAACRADGDRLGGVWDDARRAATERAFVATRPQRGEEIFTHARAQLDGYAARWRDLRVEACLASRVRGDEPAEVLRLRDACLDERLEEVRALVDAFAGGDPKVVEHAAEAVRALEPVAACADPDQLDTAIVLPWDPVARGEIDALRTDLLHAKAWLDAVVPKRALAVLRSIEPRVARTGYAPLIARWRLYTARALSHAGDPATPAAYDALVRFAEAHRLDRLRALALIELGSYVGSWAGKPDEGHRWLQLGQSVIDRLGGDPRLQADALIEEGWIFQYEHKLSAALPLFDRAIGILEQNHLENESDKLSSARSGLAASLVAAERFDDAIAQDVAAVAAAEAAEGPRSPLVTGYLNNLAMTQLAAGHLDDALASIDRAIGLMEDAVRTGELDAGSADLGLAEQSKAEVELRRGDATTALALLGRARDVAVALQGADYADLALIDVERAQALRMLGRLDDARRAVGDAQALAARNPDVPKAVAVDAWIELARVALAGGRDGEAADAAQRATQLADDAEITSWDRAELDLALATALAHTHGDPARARALAQQAEATFIRLRAPERAAAAHALISRD
jgi:tRNA A-37 threonylcarbamoyl transferase component Bud32/tetratricopeptide (TPR) repeat protein